MAKEKEKAQIKAVEMVRRIRDEQARLLEGKSEAEIIAFFRKAGETGAARQRRGDLKGRTRVANAGLREHRTMDMNRKQQFLRLWEKYFPGAELPITFYYTDETGSAELVKLPAGHRCIFADLARVRAGEALRFDVQSIGCFGGKRYTGFSTATMPNFEYFLSCGIPGRLEGERYKKTPELVKEWIGQVPELRAPARFIVFKRWDLLEEIDTPVVAIFFAGPDVLSGLFTLANFDVAGPNGVFAPFGAGCASTIQYPYFEGQSDSPRGVLGLFDVSARPFVSSDTLTFSVPMGQLQRMMDNMDDSFLTTESWHTVQRRIGKRENGANP